MIGVWPEDWRAELAAAFDAERDGPPEILVVYVAEDGRYTGDVWRIRPGEPGRLEHDPGLVGLHAEGVAVYPRETDENHDR